VCGVVLPVGGDFCEASDVAGEIIVTSEETDAPSAHFPSAPVLCIIAMEYNAVRRNFAVVNTR
jgi:hypothetical protein